MVTDNWYTIENPESVFSPAMLVYPARIEENIKRMISMAGNPDRLRPHVKTHKLGEVVKLQVDQGIRKFKCATLTEAEMVAGNGGKDILLAYPLVGPDVDAWIELQGRYPQVKFSCTVDSKDSCKLLLQSASEKPESLNLFVDLDNGMHRTGLLPSQAVDLIRFISDQKGLHLEGLHIYDGHIHEEDLSERKIHCDKDFEPVLNLVNELKENGIEIGELACGGTPTFPIHAAYADRTLCPGTTLLWDAGYGSLFRDLDFLPAAALAGRVISRPEDQLCLDLGHKAVASEMAHPRLHFLGMNQPEMRIHSEEHLVIFSHGTANLKTGDFIYALPTHICPTMALHEKVYVVQDHRVVDTWEVVARKRFY